MKPQRKGFKGKKSDPGGARAKRRWYGSTEAANKAEKVDKKKGDKK